MVYLILPLLLLALSSANAKAGVYEFHPTLENTRSSRLADTENIQFWMNKARDELNKAEQNTRNTNRAKNIIIFVGDGMSIPTVTAARVFKGQFFSQDKGIGDKEGNSASIHWENFPNMGLSKTYSVTGMVPDSASTATAMFSGVKTVSWTLGYDSHIIADNATSAKDATPLPTLLDWAQAAGKSTGFITNTRVTHATPAALYAKSANRNWECDSKMEGKPEDLKDLKDIARQMIEDSPGKDTDLVMGGGLAPFVNFDLLEPPSKTKDFDYAEEYWNCHRNDNRSLVKEWQAENPNGKLILNKKQLMDPELMKADKIRGFFSWSYMPYEDQLWENTTFPNLEEMTSTAIKYLQQKSGDNGFFLMVEGGKIDHAHHSSQATRALRETIGLDRAVAAATQLVSTDDSLILVTADHAHTFSMGGYADRFADITREVQEEPGKETTATDKKKFTIMAYANGPGFDNNVVSNNNIVRPDIPKSLDYEFVSPSGIPLKTETHGGDDVGIWATGPMSHYFHSVHEQTHIAHVAAYAACIGPYSEENRCKANSAALNIPGFSLILSVLYILTNIVH